MEVTLLGTGDTTGTPTPNCGCGTCREARERGVERSRFSVHVHDEATGETGGERVRRHRRTGCRSDRRPITRNGSKERMADGTAHLARHQLIAVLAAVLRRAPGAPVPSRTRFRSF